MLAEAEIVENDTSHLSPVSAVPKVERTKRPRVEIAGDINGITCRGKVVCTLWSLLN